PTLRAVVLPKWDEQVVDDRLLRLDRDMVLESVGSRNLRPGRASMSVCVPGYIWCDRQQRDAQWDVGRAGVLQHHSGADGIRRVGGEQTCLHSRLCSPVEDPPFEELPVGPERADHNGCDLNDG